MYVRPCFRTKNGKRHAYWALVESYRTERGPRQRVVAYLGDLDEAGRLGVKQAAGRKASSNQPRLFDDVKPHWVEVDANAVRVERTRDFGGPWLGLELLKQLDLVSFLERVIPRGREDIPWPPMALILVLSRLCDPSSELYIAEHAYQNSALADLLGVPEDKVNEDRLYRALDQLLPHKAALEQHLKEKLGDLFDLKYDLLMYDVTSTYFEGEAKRNPQAQRGYSRDHRPDCKQVCIGLVVSECGMPVGYEVFAGNRHDGTTVEEIVETMESRYGRADRIWVLDRGMINDHNMEFLRAEGRPQTSSCRPTTKSPSAPRPHPPPSASAAPTSPPLFTLLPPKVIARIDAAVRALDLTWLHPLPTVRTTAARRSRNDRAGCRD